jgi:phosphopantetheine--protein transferase-like protein
MVSLMNDEILNRFNKIQGQENSTVDLNRLSSAQRARFISWLRENNFSIPETTQEIETTPELTSTFQSDEESISIGTKGIGVDIQFIPELFPSKVDDLKSDPEILRIFSRHEIAFAETKRKPNETLTGIFAAKEAIIKAGFQSKSNSDLNKIEILHSEDGKPEFPDYALSISHSNEYAIAIAQKNEVVQKKSKLATPKESDAVYENNDAIKQSKNIVVQGFSKTSTLALIIILSLIIANFSDLLSWVNLSIF